MLHVRFASCIHVPVVRGVVSGKPVYWLRDVGPGALRTSYLAHLGSIVVP